MRLFNAVKGIERAIKPETRDGNGVCVICGIRSSNRCHLLERTPITSEELETEISNLKIGKAVGPSSTPVLIVKTLKGALSEPLQIILNASFLTGIVPERFKLARVYIPVFKKGAQVSLNNYRPISLLSIFN